MKHATLYAAALLLATASCASHHRDASVPARAEPITARVGGDSSSLAPRRLDSVVVTPHWSILDKVIGRTPAPLTDIHVGQWPARIGKKSTVSIYYGPATVTNAGKKAQVLGDGATVQAKKGGPVIKADSGASVQVAITKKGPAAAAGHDAAATETKGSLPWWFWLIVAGIAGYAGIRLYKKYAA